MLAVLSDTHSQTGHELQNAARDAVENADAVIHAGDFTTPAALDAFHEADATLYPVHGNADTAAVTDRLPEARVVTSHGATIAVTHRQQGGGMGLAFFGRERGADLVVSGHTHRASVTETDDVVLLNPGSHADPRGGQPTHAELRRESEDELAGRIVHRNGDGLETFSLPLD